MLSTYFIHFVLAKSYKVYIQLLRVALNVRRYIGILKYLIIPSYFMVNINFLATGSRPSGRVWSDSRNIQKVDDSDRRPGRRIKRDHRFRRVHNTFFTVVFKSNGIKISWDWESKSGLDCFTEISINGFDDERPNLRILGLRSIPFGFYADVWNIGIKLPIDRFP